MDGDKTPNPSEQPNSSQPKHDDAATANIPPVPTAEVPQQESPRAFSSAFVDDDWTKKYDVDDTEAPRVKPITWTASEFIGHDKSFTWYLALGGGAIVVAALIYLLTRDVISTAVIVVVALVFGYAASRKPRTLPYRLDSTGLTIAVKFYPYGQFRSFAVLDDGPFSSIIFMPLKRFMPQVEIYYEPKDEEQIVTLLSDRLPIETHKLDPVDRFMRHIRF